MQLQSVFILLGLFVLHEAWLPPISLPIYESRYLQLHVGRPGKDVYFAFDFSQNVTQVAFYPWLYSTTYVDSSDIFYFGPMPIRLNVVSSTESIIGLGPASPLWQQWSNITISPRKFVLGEQSTAFDQLAIARCGSATTSFSGVSVVPSSSITYLPAIQYDMSEFPVLVNTCNVTIRSADSVIYSDTGLAMDMREETTGSSIILGLPVILRHFVYFRDFHSGIERVGVSAEETEINYWVLVGSIVLTAILCINALIAIAKPKTYTRSWINITCIVLCAVTALVIAIHPSTMDVARLRFNNLFATVPGVAIPLVLICGVTIFWAVPWMVSAGLCSLWLLSLWDMGDYIGTFYRLFWGILLANWQSTLTIVRQFRGDDIALSIMTILFVITYVLYPICTQIFALTPYVPVLATIIFSIGGIFIPVQLLSLFYWLRQKREKPFAKDVFIPID